jgi:hypothetical protein
MDSNGRISTDADVSPDWQANSYGPLQFPKTGLDDASILPVGTTTAATSWDTTQPPSTIFDQPETCPAIASSS